MLTSNAVLIPSTPENQNAYPRPLRILHVLEATLGGTLRYLENIADAMDGSPFHFGFAFGDSRADSRLDPFLKTIDQRGWRAYPIAMCREVDALKDWAALTGLRRAILAFEPDILHCHSSKAGILGRLASRTVLSRPTVLYNPHALAVPLGKKFLYIERALSGLVDHYIAVSEGEADDIVRYGVSRRSKVQVVFPAIDTRVFSPRDKRGARIALGLTEAPLVLGLGRLTQQKNPLSFLRIVEKARRQLPGLRALWIGDGDLTAAFHETVASLGLKDYVQLVPWQHDVRLHLAAADALLCTSLYESFGYMAAEALAMQVPVVAPQVSGPRDILVGPLARQLFPAGDEERARDLLLNILTQSDYALEQGRLGRELVMQRFSPKEMRASLTACYHCTTPQEQRAHL